MPATSPHGPVKTVLLVLATIGVVGYVTLATTLGFSGTSGANQQAGAGEPTLVEVSCQENPLSIIDIYDAPLDTANGYTPTLRGFEISGVSPACAGMSLRVAAAVSGTFSEFEESIPVTPGQTTYRFSASGSSASPTSFASGYSVTLLEGPFTTSQLAGTLQVGRQLTHLVNASSGVTSTYRWERSLDNGSSWTTVQSSSDPTYTTLPADQGSLLRSWAAADFEGRSWQVSTTMYPIAAAGNGSLASPVAVAIPFGLDDFDTVWDNYTAILAPSNWGTTRISWHAWTPPVSGTVRIRTQMLQAWDSNMQVFDAAGTLIAENDDFPDENAPCTYATNCSYNSQVIFAFEAGQTYRIGLGGFFGKTGSARVYFKFSDVYLG